MKKFWQVLKKIFNFSWKLGIVTVSIIVFFLYIDIGADDIVEYFETSWTPGEFLSDDIVIMENSRNPDERTYNLRTKKYISPKVVAIVTPSTCDSLVAFQAKNQKWGYINKTTGRIQIDAQYSNAGNFRSGRAAVVNEFQKMYFIDYSGNRIGDFEMDYIGHYNPLQLEGGFYIVEVKDGSSLFEGVIDNEGKWALDPVYHSICNYAGLPYFSVSQGRRTQERVGLVTDNFDWVLPCEYEEIDFADDLNSIFLTKDGDKKLVSLDGTVLIPNVIDSVLDMYYLDANKVAEDMLEDSSLSDKFMKFKVGAKYGVMSRKTGKVILPARYFDVSLATEDIIKAQFDSDGELLLYDSSGNRI